MFIINKVVKKSFIAHLSKLMFSFFLRVYKLYSFIAPRPNWQLSTERDRMIVFYSHRLTHISLEKSVDK